MGWMELAAKAFEPKTLDFETPGDLARHLTPATLQTPALDLIDEALINAFCTPDARLIVSMPPQNGKSTRVAEVFPMWVLLQNPETRIVTASYSQGLARRNGRAIRRHIETHGKPLGLTLRRDVAAQNEWQLEGHAGGVYSTGIGGSLTGRPSDMMIIDDPIKDSKEADSVTFRDNVWDWWQSVGSTRLAPGAPVIIILTRWHEDDIAGRLMSAEDGHLWQYVNIPAQADHDPAKGETDILGREPGVFMESARGHTPEQWAAVKRSKGSRVWNALYQGRPAPSEGGLFKRSDWQYYDRPLWIETDGVCRTTGAADELILSWDMAFKATQNSDYVAGQVWLKRGADAYLLDQKHGRLTFTETLAAFEAMVAKWPQASAKLIEEAANGAAILDSLKGKIPGLIPVKARESKEARAAAVTPFIEAGNVHLPRPAIAPWVDGLVEEAAAFPNGANDDRVDALTQALNRLFLRGGQGSAFLNAMKARAEKDGITIPSNSRNWRQAAANLKNNPQTGR